MGVRVDLVALKTPKSNHCLLFLSAVWRANKSQYLGRKPRHNAMKTDIRVYLVYAPQTKILEGGTKDVVRMFESDTTFHWSVLQIEYSRP